MKQIKEYILIILLGSFLMGQIPQGYESIPMKYWPIDIFEQYINPSERVLHKGASHVDRNFSLADGNKLRTLIYNYGSIGRPNTEPSIEWPIFSNHGYAYEFGFVVGAEVEDIHGITVQIFSDGMIDGGDRNQSGGSNVWGWEPVQGYGIDKDIYNTWNASDKNKGGIAMSNRPESWGELFPQDEESSESVWPGMFGNGVITADLESYYVMDDRYNEEFDYYPVPSDSSIRGMGVQVTARGFQYSASLAEDIIFAIYEIENVSEKPLEKVVLGMIGDPHIGGANDFNDDFAGFINALGQDSESDDESNIGNMVYCWDKEGSSNNFGLPWENLGWLGFKFLESPSNPYDSYDNDGDGLVDESMFDGIDNDGDWQSSDALAEADTPEDDIYNGIDDDGDGRIDDLGDLDKKSDDLNGNGVPDIGEPDFDYMDTDEGDQLGLTSFTAPVYATKQASQDDVIWDEMVPGNFAETMNPFPEGLDNIFIFGSGYFSLDVGEKQRFAIAIIMGENKADMIENAEIAEWIYKMNFQFTKPPDPPRVTAVPDNNCITLYWNSISEESVDPVFGNDFEGYKIYRSTKKGEWGQAITDNHGITIGYHPLAQYDLVNEHDGNHPTPWANGALFDMGKNTGLVHSFSDFNLLDGITYYYAVTAYNHGSISGKVAPLESSKSFGGPNVVEVIPNAPSAGYVSPEIDLGHVSGYATATLGVNLIDPRSVDSDTYYEIAFHSFDFDSLSSLKWQPSLNLSDKTVWITENKNGSSTVLYGDYSLNDIVNVWNNSLNVGPYILSFNDLTTDNIVNPSYEWIDNEPILDLEIEKSSDWITFLFTRDFEIEFSDKFIGMDYTGDSTYLKITNTNENIPMVFKFKDYDGDGFPDVGDYIRIYLYQSGSDYFYNNSLGGQKKSVYKFTFIEPIDSTQTDTVFNKGSKLVFTTPQPFDSHDIFQINAIQGYIDNFLLKESMEKIAVVPNPYVMASSYEVPPPDVFSTGRGERAVHFIHLPTECTIKIFTISGEHIRTIQHSSTLWDGTESWNLLSRDGLDVASGIYIYHIITPEKYEKIGRIALIK